MICTINLSDNKAYTFFYAFQCEGIKRLYLAVQILIECIHVSRNLFKISYESHIDHLQVIIKRPESESTQGENLRGTT